MAKVERAYDLYEFLGPRVSGAKVRVVVGDRHFDVVQVNQAKSGVEAEIILQIDDSDLEVITEEVEVVTGVRFKDAALD